MAAAVEVPLTRFNQSPSFQDLLVSTGDCPLVHSTPDPFWGGTRNYCGRTLEVVRSLENYYPHLGSPIGSSYLPTYLSGHPTVHIAGDSLVNGTEDMLHELSTGTRVKYRVSSFPGAMMSQIPSLLEESTTPMFRAACDVLIVHAGHNDVTTKDGTPNQECPTATDLFYRTLGIIPQLRYLYGNDTAILFDSLMSRPDSPPNNPGLNMAWFRSRAKYYNRHMANVVPYIPNTGYINVWKVPEVFLRSDGLHLENTAKRRLCSRWTTEVSAMMVDN